VCGLGSIGPVRHPSCKYLWRLQDQKTTTKDLPVENLSRKSGRTKKKKKEGHLHRALYTSLFLVSHLHNRTRREEQQNDHHYGLLKDEIHPKDTHDGGRKKQQAIASAYLYYIMGLFGSEVEKKEWPFSLFDALPD
jgi:hypothetical protein